MTTHPVRSRDALYMQLRELQETQRGISPKLSLHAELGRQIAQIKQNLGDQDMGTIDRKMIPELRSSTGSRIKFFRPEAMCTHKRPDKCAVSSCKNMPKAHGHCHSCGRTKYAKHCRKHKGNHG